MTNTQRYADGDRVKRIEVLGSGDGARRREYEGTVIDVGKKGVKVRFDNAKLGVAWVPNGSIRMLEEAKPDKPARVASPLPSLPAPVARLVVPPPAKVVSGIDADLSALREMARSLVTQSEDRVRVAKGERDMLHEEVEDAKKNLGEAEESVAAAERDLAQVMRLAGAA